MKKHTKIFMDYFGYGIEDFIPCEVCERKRAVDINHIQATGMGGSKTKDYIENLMAVCRECHIAVGDVPDKKEWLKEVHKKFMLKHKL